LIFLQNEPSEFTKKEVKKLSTEEKAAIIAYRKAGMKAMEFAPGPAAM
jgi:hypothetical protein